MHPLRQAQHPNPPNTRAQKQKKNSQRKGEEAHTEMPKISSEELEQII